MKIPQVEWFCYLGFVRKGLSSSVGPAESRLRVRGDLAGTTIGRGYPRVYLAKAMPPMVFLLREPIRSYRVFFAWQKCIEVWLISMGL